MVEQDLSRYKIVLLESRETRLEQIENLLGQRHILLVFLGLSSIVELLIGLLLLLLLLWVLLLLGILLLGALLLPTILRGSTKRIRSVVMRLSILLLVVGLVWRGITCGWVCSAAGQVNIHSPLVLLGMILQAKLLTNLFDGRLDLLDMVDRVVTFADDDMKMRLAILLGVLDALGDNLFCFFDELAVEIYGIAIDAADGIVLAEDIVRGLFVELIGFGGVVL